MAKSKPKKATPKKKAQHRSASRTPVKPKPRQARLPGTEDSAINAIEKAAFRYIEARDERMQLTEAEVAAKQDLLDEMHRANKDHYQRGALTVDIVVESETVKARLKKVVDADDEPERIQLSDPHDTQHGGEPFNAPDADAGEGKIDDEGVF